jgi:fumarate reductase subunit C
MSRNAHPNAMAPSKPGNTRTAPPQLPDRFPFGGRYLAYTLFDLTGFVYLLLGLFALCAVWSLGSGEVAWNGVLARYRGGPYLAFHALALVSVIFVGIRFFGFFPKAQPPRIGPAKPPPQSVILALLYALWIGVAGLMSSVLAGGIFR